MKVVQILIHKTKQSFITHKIINNQVTILCTNTWVGILLQLAGQYFQAKFLAGRTTYKKVFEGQNYLK